MTQVMRKIHVCKELTFREREVLLLRVEDHSRNQIALILGIAESTVKTHLEHIHQKLGVSTQVELIRLVATTSKS